jgi:hypothetical protein
MATVGQAVANASASKRAADAEDDLSDEGNSTPYSFSCAVLDGFLPLMYASYHAR